jgi:3-dehydroquinate synthase
MSITRIPVGGERPYEVVVGTGALGELPGLVGKEAATVFVVSSGSVSHIAHPACHALEDAGYRVVAEQVPDGEAAKQIPVAAGLWSRLAA